MSSLSPVTCQALRVRGIKESGEKRGERRGRGEKKIQDREERMGGEERRGREKRRGEGWTEE